MLAILPPTFAFVLANGCGVCLCCDRCRALTPLDAGRLANQFGADCRIDDAPLPCPRCARSFVMPVDHLNARDVAAILTVNVSREARLMTDEAGLYKRVGRAFADHQSVAHARDEYVSKADRTVHTN